MKPRESRSYRKLNTHSPGESPSMHTRLIDIVPWELDAQTVPEWDPLHVESADIEWSLPVEVPLVTSSLPEKTTVKEVSKRKLENIVA